MNPSLADRIKRAVQALINANTRNDQACFSLADEEMARLVAEVGELERKLSPDTPV